MLQPNDVYVKMKSPDAKRKLHFSMSSYYRGLGLPKRCTMVNGSYLAISPSDLSTLVERAEKIHVKVKIPKEYRILLEQHLQ